MNELAEREREAAHAIEAMEPQDKIRMGLICAWLYGQLGRMPTNVEVLAAIRRRDETGVLSTH